MSGPPLTTATEKPLRLESGHRRRGVTAAMLLLVGLVCWAVIDRLAWMSTGQDVAAAALVVVAGMAIIVRLTSGQRRILAVGIAAIALVVLAGLLLVGPSLACVNGSAYNIPGCS